MLFKRSPLLALAAALLAPGLASAQGGGVSGISVMIKSGAIEAPAQPNVTPGAADAAAAGRGAAVTRIEPGVTDRLTLSGFDNPDTWLGRLDYGRVLSDFAMENVNSLTADDVQKLFEANGSALARPIDGKRPADMLIAAARKYGISPKVLCATLQKEQGLVTKKTATRARLDWALGVGVFDNGKRLTAYKGFDKQIEGAAETLRKLFDEGKKKFDGGAKSVTYKTLEGDVVKIRNAATWALFEYTPHLSGNKLFHQIYRRFEERGWRAWSAPKIVTLGAANPGGAAPEKTDAKPKRIQ